MAPDTKDILKADPRLAEMAADRNGARETRRKRMLPARTWNALREEVGNFHPRLLLMRMVLFPLPTGVGPRLRARVMSLFGFSLGKGTLFADMPSISGGKGLFKNLRTGKECWINVQTFLELHAPVTLGDRAGLGQQSMILTQRHHLGSPARRYAELEALPVTIGAGVWVGARAMILPGVTIGDGAVIAAGAVVTKDVPANTVVAGVPAAVVRELE